MLSIKSSCIHENLCFSTPENLSIFKEKYVVCVGVHGNLCHCVTVYVAKCHCITSASPVGPEDWCSLEKSSDGQAGAQNGCGVVVWGPVLDGTRH